MKDTKSDRKGGIDRGTILIIGVIAMIVAISWFLDCEFNPAAHSQTLSQGIHELFHH